MESRAVVSGATSMIGVACVESCLREGMEVLALVRPGSDKLNRLPDDARLRIAPCRLDALDGFSAGEQAFDLFFHLAWEGTSRRERVDPVCQQKNIQYALDAVRLAHRLGCKKFIGVGSQAEYGPSNDWLRPDSPVRPVMAYGAAKYAASVLCGIECQRLGMQFCWARIFSVYGPNDGEQTLIGALIRALLERRKMPLTACEQKWDYLYAADCGRALRLIGERGKDRSVYCVGSGKVRPLGEYVRTLRDAIDPTLPLGIGEAPYAEDQVMFLGADIRALTEDTGFVPQITFEEGIRRTIADIAAKKRTAGK